MPDSFLSVLARLLNETNAVRQAEQARIPKAANDSSAPSFSARTRKRVEAGVRPSDRNEGESMPDSKRPSDPLPPIHARAMLNRGDPARRQ